MINIKSQKNSKSMQEILSQGMKSDFWNILVQALNDNKEDLRNKRGDKKFRDLPPELYKLESELLEARIEYIDNMLDLPNSVISWLKSPDQSKADFDPYSKAEEE